MTEAQTQSLEAQYAEALQHEKAALHALQAHDAGTDGNAHAWQEWSEAISRTNQAWRELSSHSLGRHPHGLPATARFSAPGAAAPSR